MIETGEIISLENIGNGAAAEMFEREMEAVMKDIADPNTKATAPRSVTVTVTIIPNENRTFGAVQIGSSKKLAPVIPFSAEVAIGREGGRMVARNIEDPQGNMFGDGDKVVPIEKGGKQE